MSNRSVKIVVHRTLEVIKMYLAKGSKLEHEAAHGVQLAFARYVSAVFAKYAVSSFGANFW